MVVFMLERLVPFGVFASSRLMNCIAFQSELPDYPSCANMHPSLTCTAFDPSPEPVSRFMAGGVIADVALQRLKMNVDLRGCFTEVFQEAWNTCIKPVQWSVVHSHSGVFRGMHLHRRHDEYISVLAGRVSVGLRDLRPWSRTRDMWALYDIRGDDLACLTFPAGVLHGWYAQQPTMHLQAVSESYRDYGTTDNWGCHWSDPALEIPWPFTDPIVSVRASDFSTVRELTGALGPWPAP
jgi:dTDP-4-dehydrorhamnose 3,5-epimerase